MIDQNKRKSLKQIAVSGAVAVTSIPVIASAISNGKAPQSGVTVTYYDNLHGHTVLFRNATDKSIALQQVDAGRIDTPNGVLDLNTALGSKGLTLSANSTQAVSVTYEGEAYRYAKWTHIKAGGEIAHAGVERQSINVVSLFGGNTRSDTLARVVVA